MKEKLKNKKTIEKLKEIAKGLGPISDAVDNKKENKSSMKKDEKSLKTSKLEEIRAKFTEKPNSKFTLGNTKYKVDSAGTAYETSDGYISPTKKGGEYLEKQRKKGIILHAIDPIERPEGFSRSTKEHKKKKK